jgi:hypothetical protein
LKIFVVAIAWLAPPLVTAVLRILILYEFIMNFNRAEFYWYEQDMNPH